MKLVPILIFWSLALLQVGGYDRCPTWASRVNDTDGLMTSMVIHSGTHDPVPGQPNSGNQGASLEDEDETLEDGFLSASLSGLWQWQDAGPDDLARVAHARQGLLRTPRSPHPLRC
jgi:hypothetical protein